MTRIEQPLAIPREMSSRSANVSARRERRRVAGAIPPWRANRKWMTCLSLPSTRPIAFNDCPAFQRFHISARWAKDSFHRLCIMNTTLRKTVYIRWCCIDRLSRQGFSESGELLPRTRKGDFSGPGLKVEHAVLVAPHCELENKCCDHSFDWHLATCMR